MDKNDNIKEGDCAICLDVLNLKQSEIYVSSQNNITTDSIQVSKEEEIKSSNKFNINLKQRIRNIGTYCKEFIEGLKFKYKKTPYMRPPCGHCFHTVCFEPWIEKKSECPYCKSKIPSLE